jgi:hypothetical protein
MVLDQVQMLDQQVTPARARAEQCAYLRERARIDLPALWGAPGPPAPARRLANCATS